MSLQNVVSGLLLGGMLALIGMGFSLVWGILNIVNLAHAPTIMFGAYITYYFYEGLHIDPFLALPITMGILAIFGFLLQQFLINRIIKSTLLITFLLTFGLEVMFVNLGRLIFSGVPRTVKTDYDSASFSFLSAEVSFKKLAGLGIALILTFLLYLFMSRTKIGNAIRATSMDLNAAKLMGINIANIYTVTYAISAALAGAAGALLSTWNSFTPDEFGKYNIRAFAVVVLGGLGSIPGALIGGLAFGFISEIIGGLTIGSGLDAFTLSPWKEGILFLSLVLVLIIRPQGLMGKEGYR
ncbi:MAG: branched-chain amino acid ABC transporter permease [Chloroflexi bacterium]|uniref:Branched-chain amino acid ABC transporter permease n=1 Tax=Candidatus Chlorohelix allophototropha TaxID=3003348 RepID=A0A8T7MA86_9CHLR|nr:branched-chain amino acid ABC transporter permease [Chloroflexota bacterium]WJW68973.1 branched-chain amino acid ABC transporter permease [Chloroflexota bacterium L227-S17]